MYLQLGSPQFKLLGPYVPRRRHCSLLIMLSVCTALPAAAAGAQPADEGTIDTVAGSAGVAQVDLSPSSNIAVDGAGNLYIADRNRIHKVDTAGIITTVAGSHEAGFSGDDGPAVEARLNGTRGIAVDKAGALYFADSGNNRIRKVDTAGIITTVAGSGEAGFSGDDGPAVEARLNDPRGVTADGAGNLFIADTNNHHIRKVDVAGIITTVAGSGNFGWFGGDDGSAVRAQLNQPQDVALDEAGNLYIADSGNRRIRKVNAAGVITTFAGTGLGGYRRDGGSATRAQLTMPIGVAADGAGNIYIADSGNHTVRRVDAADIITTFAGTGEAGFSGDGGPAIQAQLDSPGGAAVDGAGNLFIADGNRIRKVDAAGTITTVAGEGRRFSGDGGPATAAQFYDPRDVAVDGAGNIFIADRYNHRIRKVNAAGTITTVAGTVERGFSGDGGPATQARLDIPVGVAVDGSGNIFIADQRNHRIRKVDAAGTITTVAGSGGSGIGEGGYSGDGGPATAAQLRYPAGVAVDGSGNIFIAGGSRIRKVDAAGTITTVAGTGERGFSGDGGPATAAQLHYPAGVAVDRWGNFFIAGGNRIRKVDAAGTITTVAGTGERGFSGDGGPATAAQLHYPAGVAVDETGNLYFADSGNNRIRRLLGFPEGSPRIPSGSIVLATGTPVVNRISPNALISVFGQDFAPEGTQALSPRLDAAGRIAANLAATCLEIDGKRAPLFAVSPDQINAQVPHDLAPGQARVAAIRGCGAEDEQRGPAATATAAAVSPAFFNFPLDLNGRNPVVALHGGGPDLAGAPGSIPGVKLTPAEPGAVVTLYGTGFGATEPRLEAGRIPGTTADLAGEISFTFGGIAVPPWDVSYAGAAPCCAGLYQFTVRLPPTLPDGNAPVIATVQGVATPAGPYLTVRRRR